MFSKILIANRGEIAVRIIRACKEMGVATVAVYSEADKNALHVALADQSYCIGSAEASESYLNENQIISTAILAGAQAIHPGYGFLSENAHFARLCRKNGLVFIGPAPDSMERLSDKAALKELISGTGLSVIPGTKALSSIEEAVKAGERIGYPLMLKACAGGGGRGLCPGVRGGAGSVWRRQRLSGKIYFPCPACRASDAGRRRGACGLSGGS